MSSTTAQKWMSKCWLEDSLGPFLSYTYSSSSQGHPFQTEWSLGIRIYISTNSPEATLQVSPHSVSLRAFHLTGIDWEPYRVRWSLSISFGCQQVGRKRSSQHQDSKKWATCNVWSDPKWPLKWAAIPASVDSKMFQVKTLQQKSTFADYNRPFRCFGYTSLAKKPDLLMGWMSLTAYLYQGAKKSDITNYHKMTFNRKLTTVVALWRSTSLVAGFILCFRTERAAGDINKACRIQCNGSNEMQRGVKGVYDDTFRI